MRRTLTPLFFIVLAAAAASFASHHKAQDTCPITGKPVTPAGSHVDWEGQRVHFCCAGCPAKFKADPEPHFARFAAEGTVLENIQESCPVSGQKLGSHGTPTHLDHKGRRVRFCCDGCVPAFTKEPEKYLQALPGEHPRQG